MDRFLKDQVSGEVVDTQNPFTIEKRRSREKLLHSIPSNSKDAVLRLLDAAAVEFHRNPCGTLSYHNPDNADSYFKFKLPQLGAPGIQKLVDELRRPFSTEPGYSKLAKAIFRATRLESKVSLDLYGKYIGTFLGKSLFQLSADNMEIPEQLAEITGKGLDIIIAGVAMYPRFFDYKLSPGRLIHRFHQEPEKILPLESPARTTSGYFDYRCKPFTAIRSYATPPHGKAPLKMDLWEGPYTAIDPATSILDKKEPGKFLFLRWKPNYGRPTLIHKRLDGDLSFGQQSYGATFWVESNESPARVQFHSDNVVSDPEYVTGPSGMIGLVHWPGLTYDLWGTQLVKDERYEEALKWTQEQVDATAHCLVENLEQLIERLRASNLLKGSYADEMVVRIRQLWG